MADAFRGGLVLASLIACAFLARYLLPSHTEKFVAYATEHGWFTNELNDSMGRSLRAALVDTPLQDRWQINQPLSADRVNLYVIRIPADVKVPRDIARFCGAASYTGEGNAIVLDIGKIGQLTNDLGFATTQSGTENPYVFAARHQRETAQARELLTFWIIGHELGHLVHRDKAAHFTPDASCSSTAGQYMPGGVDAYPQYSPAAQQIEYAADRFFADQIGRAQQRRLITQPQIDQFANQLMTVLTNGYYDTVGPGARPVAGPFAFLSNANQLSELPLRDHPEFFLRAARLLTLMDHPLRDFFANHVAQFEHNLIKPPALTPALLIVHGTPDADLLFKSDKISLQHSPVRLWLPPGIYQMEISEEGFKSQLRTVTLTPHAPTQLNYRLAPDPQYAVPATRRLSDEISDANRSVDAAIHYEWFEPIPNAALWDLNRASRMLPSWSRPALLRAEILLLQHRCEEAKSDWQTGLRLLPHESSEVRNRSAYPLLELADIEADLAKNPHDADTANRYVEHLWMLDRDSQAAEFIRSLPENLQTNPAIELTAARLDDDRGDLQGALRILNRLVVESPKSDDSVSDSARQVRSQVLEELGRIGPAESDLASLPKDEHNMTLRAEFYERHGRIGRAIELRHGMLADSDPDDACHLVGLLLRAGRKPEALALVGKRKLADTLHCKVMLGEYALTHHDPSEAANQCDLRNPTTSIYEPEDVRRSTACYARALAGRNDLAGAELAYRKALWFDPLNKALRNELAAIEAKRHENSLSACDEWMAQQVAHDLQ